MTISLITVNQHVIVLAKLLISSVKVLVVYNSDQDLHQGSEGMVNSLKYLIFPKVGSLQSTKYVPGKPANDMLIGYLYSAIPGRHLVIIAHASKWLLPKKVAYPEQVIPESNYNGIII